MNLPLANLLFAPENWLVIGLVALLLFGKRLPEVGRSLGKGIIEFKKGLAGIEEDVTQAGQQPGQQPTIGGNNRAALPPAEGYKFDPYTGKPIAQEPVAPPMRFDPYTGKPLADQSSQTTSSNT
jgi:sec-independent protein translocase protein TatA